MPTEFKVPFANEHIEAACIDLQVKKWQAELLALSEYSDIEKRQKLIGMIFEGMRKASQLRVSYSQK